MMQECRLCGSKQLKLSYTQGNKNQYKYYRCVNCNLINYDLETGLNQGKYAEHYPSPFDEKLRTNVSQTQSWKFIQKYISNPGSMFEIGCGNGKLLSLAKEGGWAVSGIELSPFLVSSIKDVLDINVMSINFLEFAPRDNETYDLITLRHVLEHLPDPVLVMNKVHELLKDNGYLLLEFPNIDGIDLVLKRFLEAHHIKKKVYSPSYAPGHCHEYNKKSLQFLAKLTGFKMIKWQTYSSRLWMNPFYHRTGLGNKVRVLLLKNE